MSRRISLAGLLGGVAMFLWASLAHMVLPLGQAGIRDLPEDQVMLASLHARLGDASGFYMFPAMGSETDMQRYAQKLAANPSGLLVYHPPGAKALTAPQLITEFATELLEALLLAWLIAQTRLESFASRLGIAAVVGVVAAVTTNVSYWNWYGFPNSYTLAYKTIEFVGFMVAGLVAAKVLGRAAAVPATA